MSIITDPLLSSISEDTAISCWGSNGWNPVDGVEAGVEGVEDVGEVVLVVAVVVVAVVVTGKTEGVKGRCLNWESLILVSCWTLRRDPLHGNGIGVSCLIRLNDPGSGVSGSLKVTFCMTLPLNWSGDDESKPPNNCSLFEDEDPKPDESGEEKVEVVRIGS